MDTEKNQITEARTEPSAPGPSWKTILVGLLIGMLLAGVYVYAAKQFMWWPYGQVAPEPTTLYRNETGGFEIQHPAVWHTEVCNDSGPGGIYILVSFGDAEDLVICNSDAPIMGYFNVGVSPGAISQQEITSTMEALENAQRTTVTIDGKTATRIDGITRQLDGYSAPAGQKYVGIWLQNNQYLYRLFYAGDEENMAKFELALRSFKFIPMVNAGEVYRNDQYGFYIPLPASWKGNAVRTEQWQGRDVATGKVTEHGPMIILRHPQWRSTAQREDMPIMVFTVDQWKLIGEGTMSVGAAPIPPSLLGQNSKYLFALPARYNYDFKLGFEEVDQYVHMLVAFEI